MRIDAQARNETSGSRQRRHASSEHEHRDRDYLASSGGGSRALLHRPPPICHVQGQKRSATHYSANPTRSMHIIMPPTTVGLLARRLLIRFAEGSLMIGGGYLKERAGKKRARVEGHEDSANVG
ncbi:hypothetical protein AND_010098 [Anopheles darlingi]|uniref:Uncharacterized protein n=1 Tax=Anopheles darlingi TaxID=43151 RepID=W5J679_ANODA|nr:hypothetical protein AND_010098 [Anopheles darlingi]